MNKQGFYNVFHTKASTQTKKISRNNFTYRNTISIFHKYFQNKNNIEVLDYGCGVGTVDFYISSLGNRVTGVDISDRAIKLANQTSKNLGLQEKTKFMTNKKWDKRKNKPKFDLILCLEVIEHVNNDKYLLKRLYKDLKKGGVFILSTPSLNAPLYKLGLAKNFDNKVGHLRRYEVDKLLNSIKELGYEIISFYKEEGIIRNSLFLISPLGIFIKLIKGPISDLIAYIDKVTIPIFGESNIYVVARKP